MANLRIIKRGDVSNQEMRRLLDQMFLGTPAPVCAVGQTWSPQIDIFETVGQYFLVVELPGIDPDEIEIMADRDHIKISGCRKPISPPDSYRVHQSEISYGDFTRAFRLPSLVNPDEASAAFEHGILTISLPKETPRRTTIEVK